jgi:hypothetical protein
MIDQPPIDNAVAFCRQNELMLESEGEQLLAAELTTRDYFRLLMAKGCVLDARRVLAHVLPKRHALWWGLLCAWEAARPRPPENVTEVLSGVGRFIADPTEARRRAVEELASLVRHDTSAYCLAMAAFLSGGSMSKPDQAVVLPKFFLTGRLVGVAVYLASVAREPLKFNQRLEHYIRLGLELSREPQPWARPVPIAPEFMSSGSDWTAALLGATS